MIRLFKAGACIVAVLLIAGISLQVGAGTTGIITGVVKTAADQKVVSGANIIIDRTNLSTITDAGGRFTITNVPPGEYVVRAEMVGFEAGLARGVQVAMDEKANISIELSEQPLSDEEVVIVRPRPMITPEITNTLTLVTAQQEDLTRIDPSNVRQAGGVLSALPGVIASTDGSGQIHLRGGRADQTGWILEGMPITDPNTGMFGTNLYTTGVNKFQVYTGGFGAEFGNAISGVLNEVKKSGADSPGLTLNLEGGSAAYKDGIIEFGGGESDKFNYFVSAATQTTDLDGPIVKQQQYYDAVTKLVWPSKNNSLSLLALQGKLLGHPEFYHDTGDNGEATPHELDYMDQRYSVTALTWSHNFSPESFVTVRPYYMTTDIEQNIVGYSGMFAAISSSRTGLQVGYTGQVSPRHLLKIGGSYLSSDNKYYLYPGFPLFRADVDTSQTDLYIQDQMKLSDKWTLDAGLRREAITYDRTGNEYVVGEGYAGAPVADVTEAKTTPRVGLSYASDEKTVWKLSWGKYVKFVPSSSVQHVYFFPDMPLGGPYSLEQAMPGLGATDPQTSRAVELSFEKQLSDSSALRLTPFTASYQNLGDNYYDSTTGITSYRNLGEGKSSGLEVLYRKRMSDNWQGWVSYTYQKNRANRADLDLLDDMYYTTWDQRHTLTAVTQLVRGKCAHTFRADYGSGRMDLGTPDVQDRAQPSLVLSYGLTMKLPEGSSLGDSVYLNVFNVLNSKQTMQFRWDGTDRVQDSWVPSRFISVGVSQVF